MHANEIEIDADLVQHLIKSQCPQWAGLPLKRVESAGTDNALFRLGDELVVRLPRIDWAISDVHKEHEHLPQLAKHLPVEIPTPIFMGSPDLGYPWSWSIYSWIEGENPVVGEFDNPELLATELTEFITALHNIDSAGGPPASRGVPLVQRNEPTRKAISELEGMINTRAVTEFWEEALKTPDWTGSPVWIHADLSPGNLLLRDGRLSAVIDFGCLGVGDPACDMIPAWNLLPKKSRDHFRRALGVDDATWARGRCWALSIALIQLPYYKDTNPVLATSARHVISEIVAE